MMTAFLTLLALTPNADAGRGGGGGGGGSADLAVSVSAPAQVDVDAAETISIEVANNGNNNANGVELFIALPETATSPTVHVLGDLSNIDSRCVQVDTALECSLGRIRKNDSTTVTFDFAAPWASVDLDIDAEATTTSNEANPSDDIDGVTLDVLYVDQAITGPAGVTNRHCTGTGLQAFYECELYPSSISTHDILLEADGSITFPPGISGYTGSWTQDTDDHLYFEYYYGTTLRLTFEGNGVGGDCFEGISDFPGTGYNAGYEVCFREL